MNVHKERGAAAVEFAMVAPLLILLVLGIAEFGRAYYLQTMLSGSAREAVRAVALKNDPAAGTAAGKAAAKAAASPLALTDGQIKVDVACTATPAAGTNAKVTITYPMAFISKEFGTTLNLTGKGVMRCGG
jgi:Flp pilus assembly protein TadG